MNSSMNETGYCLNCDSNMILMINMIKDAKNNTRWKRYNNSCRTIHYIVEF
jgi:hypothetical protein